MKPGTSLSGVFVLCLLFTGAVGATPFVGVKLAQLKVEGPESKDPVNLALNLGYALDTWIADLSLVAELNHTIEDGKTLQGEELELNAQAIYLSWKTTRSMYVALRAGAVQNQIVRGRDSDYTTGPLLSASVGQVIGRTRFVIEYTSLAGDARFYGFSLEFDF
jgi:hypothetical protein